MLGAVLGTVLPYVYFAPFVAANGLNVPLLIEQLFANQISAFFGMDMLVSALVL